MKYIIYVLSFCFVMTSCNRDLGIQDDIRLYSSGLIKNSDGAALEGVDVAIKDENEILGSSITDVNGFYEFVAIKSDAEFFDVVVNEEFSNDFNEIVYRSYNTSIIDLSIGDVVLNERATLDFEINRVSDTDLEFFYSLSFISLQQNGACLITLTGEPDPDDPENTFGLQSCETPINIENSIANNESGTASNNITSFRGQAVVFTYRLGDDTAPTTETIPLTNIENSYVYEY